MDAGLQFSVQKSCAAFLLPLPPLKVDSVPSTEKEAVVADPESPQDTTQNVISEPGNQWEISALAYELWIQRGCPIGSPEVDWFRAEEELKGRKELLAVA
jgi:hypothetical protein